MQAGGRGAGARTPGPADTFPGAWRSAFELEQRNTRREERLAPLGVAGVYHGDVGCLERVGEHGDFHTLSRDARQRPDAGAPGHEVRRDQPQLTHRRAENLLETVPEQGVLR